MPPAVETQRPNHWTTREDPSVFYFRDFKARFWEGVPRLHHTTEESCTQVILRTFVIAVQFSQAVFQSVKQSLKSLCFSAFVKITFCNVCERNEHEGVTSIPLSSWQPAPFNLEPRTGLFITRLPQSPRKGLLPTMYWLTLVSRSKTPLPLHHDTRPVRWRLTRPQIFELSLG